MVSSRALHIVCHAESSLNANAETSVARGMMQLTEAAWSDVTKLHYRQAFDWETNVEVGMLYLKRLKGMLGSQGLFSYPRLAASYRYGYGALRKEKFMVSRLKTPVNRIYRKLFAGEMAPVKTPTTNHEKGFYPWEQRARSSGENAVRLLWNLRQRLNPISVPFWYGFSWKRAYL